MWENILFELRLAIPILVATLLGFMIGFERMKRSKEAGVRTHTIVCVGAALMMIVSKFAFNSDADSARVAAQIVAGVGFLGAGIIVYKKNSVHGLTTAAGIWATAGIGMACGGELYILATCATVIMIGVQCLLHTNVKIFNHKKRYLIEIRFELVDESNMKIKKMFGTDRFNRLKIENKDGKVYYSAILMTSYEFSSSQLSKIMEENSYIFSIERRDDL
jgi:putative Mg2+ transporter-C (MgtC) family protein